MKRYLLAAAVSLLSMQASASVVIEQYGDSTTAGLTTIDGKVIVAPMSSVDHLYVLLNNRFGYHAEIINKGVSQTCAATLLNGDATTPKWADRVKESKADIVTFNYGMNDAWACQRNPDQFLSDVQQLLDITLAAGKQPVLIEPNPSTIPMKSILPTYIGALNLAAEQRKVPIIQHFRIWNQIPNWEGMLSDGIHPNAQGYQLKGTVEYQVLEAMIVSALEKEAKKENLDKEAAQQK